MEKDAVALVTVIVVALAIGIFAAQPAQARATVFIADKCGMLDADGGPVVVPGRVIETESSKNNVVLICKAEIKNPRDKPIRYDAFNNPLVTLESPFIPCGDPSSDNLTTDWKEVISASGQATLICRFKS